ncbi:RNA methylase [Nitzschia inconspicua]|uniref:RNA methylase n=1 Tax=Nitzschia inconspicua TaxID=303405 RepID=A0A9K3PJ78_9STRA|nr:RNA methylase [Nitzschia inconspicua]
MDHDKQAKQDVPMSDISTYPSSSIDPSLVIQCKLCSLSFASRNKLFEHLYEQHGHSREGSPTLPFASAQSRTAASVEARSKLQNLDHEAYYRIQCRQGDLMSLEDFEVSLQYFRKPLPVAFRLVSETTGRSDDFRLQYVRHLRDLGEKDVSHQRTDKNENVPSQILKRSPYFDPSTVQVAAVPTREWSEAAQQALSDAQDVGAVNRQELCSMVPPILLLMDTIEEKGKDGGGSVPQKNNEKVEKEHFTILDLAAAPGSKTLQLMDALYTKGTAACDRTMLVANDPNRKRLLTLARRSRLAPGRSCLVLNASDGRYFPSLRKWGGYKLKFNRILADVPCSGDGTLRKLSSKEWAKWNVLNHLQLHKLQVRLLVRALQLVKKGGRVVYSTCSLDPIENEAVVTSAIAQVGGPGAYKVVPIPSNFTLGPEMTTQAMQYSRGATRWVVPHPKFTHQNQVFYHRFDEIPEDIRTKHILPSMFSPSGRSLERIEISEEEKEPVVYSPMMDGMSQVQTPVVQSSQTVQPEILQFSGYNQHDDEKPASEELSSHISELDEFSFTRDEISAYEAMLPNCCRILPHQLDSGGFFCALIERSSPSFYAICCPKQKGRSESEITNMFHGKVFRGVESPQQLQKLIASENAKGDLFFFEGHSTLEGATKWLHQHGAYIKGRSNIALPLPELVTLQNDNHGFQKKTKIRNNDSEHRQQLYIPLFQKANPKLLKEFCDFYGLPHSSDKRLKKGADNFPFEDIVIIGGGTRAAAVTTCELIDNSSKPSKKGNEETDIRQSKYFRLVLVSKETQSLYAGAAKFNPMEVGLTLCWIPIPNTASNAAQSSTAKARTHSPDGTPLPRNERSGRYGLADEAVEVVGRHATKRIFDLPREHTVRLLSESFLHDLYDVIPSTMQEGGIIARYSSDTLEGCRLLFLSCKLSVHNKIPILELLMEERTAKSWLRLLTQEY